MATLSFYAPVLQYHRRSLSLDIYSYNFCVISILFLEKLTGTAQDRIISVHLFQLY